MMIFIMSIMKIMMMITRRKISNAICDYGDDDNDDTDNDINVSDHDNEDNSDDDKDDNDNNNCDNDNGNDDIMVMEKMMTTMIVMIGNDNDCWDNYESYNNNENLITIMMIVIILFSFAIGI